ncbi:hypothetical protein YB2330_006332 [Saitoella coloradoensis]
MFFYASSPNRTSAYSNDHRHFYRGMRTASSLYDQNLGSFGNAPVITGPVPRNGGGVPRGNGSRDWYNWANAVEQATGMRPVLPEDREQRRRGPGGSGTRVAPPTARDASVYFDDSDPPPPTGQSHQQYRPPPGPPPQAQRQGPTPPHRAVRSLVDIAAAPCTTPRAPAQQRPIRSMLDVGPAGPPGGMNDNAGLAPPPSYEEAIHEGAADPRRRR